MRPLRASARFLSAAMLVWFGLLMAAPAVLHSCPQAVAGAGFDDGGGHAAHAEHERGHHTPDPPGDCRCLGSCAAASMAIVPGGATVPLAVLDPDARRLLSAPAPFAVMPPRDHVQPFATAPPTRLG